MSDFVPILAFALLIAAQFLAVIYCVHHYRGQYPEQSTRDAERPKHQGQPAHPWPHTADS